MLFACKQVTFNASDLELRAVAIFRRPSCAGVSRIEIWILKATGLESDCTRAVTEDIIHQTTWQPSSKLLDNEPNSLKTKARRTEKILRKYSVIQVITCSKKKCFTLYSLQQIYNNWLFMMPKYSCFFLQLCIAIRFWVIALSCIWIWNPKRMEWVLSGLDKYIVLFFIFLTSRRRSVAHVSQCIECNCHLSIKVVLD